MKTLNRLIQGGILLCAATASGQALASPDGNVAAWAPSPAQWGTGSHPQAVMGAMSRTAPWTVTAQEGTNGALTYAVNSGPQIWYTNGWGPALARTSPDGSPKSVLEVHQASNGATGPLWYAVGTESGGSLSWNFGSYTTGYAPRIASANGIVVEVHQAVAGSGATLMYRMGSVASGAFEWTSADVPYDVGSHPAIALFNTSNPSGPVLFIVEVHEGAQAGLLWYRTGEVTASGITWNADHQYDQGYAPTITAAGTVAVETHQATNGVGALWSNSGGIDATADLVYFEGSYLYDNGFSPSIAWNDSTNTGLEVHAANSGTTSLFSHAFTTVGSPKPLELAYPPPTNVADALTSYPARQNAFLEHMACGHPPPSPGFMNPQGAQANNLDDIRSGTAFQFPGQAWSETALAMIAYKGTCWGTETWADRVAMLNSSLTQLQTHGQELGTSAACRQGELDTALKDLIPILFTYGGALSAQARTSLLNFLTLVDAEPAGPTSNSVWVGCFPAGVTIPETENHINLINSTRYLIDQWISANGGDRSYNPATNGLRNFWLTNLQVIMQSDFEEYNARPYNKYSLDAIENLAEFATDPAVQVAAQSVLDYMSAKFALSSSFGRRNSPYRRRISGDGPDYFSQWDEEQCRFVLYAGPSYAGTSPLLPIVSDASGNRFIQFPEGCGLVVRQAAGTYFPPPMTLELAMNKAGNPYFQRYSNGTNAFHNLPGGVELYDNEGPFLIAAGGIPLQALYDDVLLGINASSGDDRGQSIPTVVMPNIVYTDPNDPRNGTNREDLLRFAGDRLYVSNTCVAPGFACGVNPMKAALCSAPWGLCSTSGPWTFINFGTANDGFYVALWSAPVPGDPSGDTIGFLEAVPASTFGYNRFGDFQQKVLTNNPASQTVATVSYSSGIANMSVTYNSVREGAIKANLGAEISVPLGFGPQPSGVFDYVYAVASESANANIPGSNIQSWPLAQSSPGQAGVTSIGHSGTSSLTVIGYGTCTWDLSNFNAPTRTGACDAKPANYIAGELPPIAAVTQSGRSDFFALDSNRGIVHETLMSAGYSGWESLGGTFESHPVAVAGAHGAGTVDVFAQGTDGAYYHKYWDGQSWQPAGAGNYERLQGTFLGEPAVASIGAGRMDVFGAGTDHAYYHQAWSSAGNGWAPLDRVGGQFNGPPTVTLGPGVIDIFGRGTDNGYYHKAFDGSNYSPSGIGNWQVAGPGHFVTDPVVSALGSQIDVFGQGTDMRYYHSVATLLNGNWSAGNLEALSGTYIGPPTVARQWSGPLDVFGQGADGGYSHLQLNDGVWSGIDSTAMSGYGGGTALPDAVGLKFLIVGLDHEVWLNEIAGSTWFGIKTIGGNVY